MKNIIIADSAGFCAGVTKAVHLAEYELSQRRELWCLGELIHNHDEINRLSKLGLRTANTLEEIPDGVPVLIRSHGVGRSIYTSLSARGCEIIDGTCGKVSHIHRIAQDTENEGRQLIVFGDPEHPEVCGICGWCKNSVVVRNIEELDAYLNLCAESPKKPVTLAFQSTETQKNFKFSVNLIKKICTNAKVFDTICNATQIRQSEALDLGKKCNAVVVVGGKHSANSRHLVAICAEVCDNVFFAENAKEVDLSPLVAFDTIGITAGASVPQHIIKEVVQKMYDEMNQMNQVAEPSVESIGDAAEAVVEAVAESAVEAVEATADSVVEAVEAAVEPAVEAVEAAVEPAVEAAVEPAVEAVEPVIEAVENDAKPVIEGEKSFAELLEDEDSVK